MIKQRLRQALALLLLIVFFYSTTPRDFLHLLANHRDTIDLPYQHSQDVSNRHIHCEFLHINIAPYIAGAAFHLHHFTFIFQEYKAIIPPVPYCFAPRTSSLRAPPCV